MRMGKSCPKCGKEFPDDKNFCDNCGVQLAVKQVAPVAAQSQVVQPPVQQPKGLKKIGIIIGIVAIVAVVIVLLLYFLVFQNNATATIGQLVGEWDEEYHVGIATSDATWTFSNDGTVIIEDNNYASRIVNQFSIEGDKICFSHHDYTYYHCYDYKFSEGGSKVTLSVGGTRSIVLNKK